MRCKHIDYTYLSDFSEEFNEIMEQIEEDGDVVLNIKYLDVPSEGFGAIILYCTKAEVRGINIDKLLKDL
tara:strand:+ start:3064 stop:3273 length:210 start_codon:yes stop_codon:yes gene_type:complete